MKGRRIFIISIGILFTAGFILQQNLKQQFSWTPSFSHSDRNPFGCYVFDSIMSNSMRNGYTVNDSSLYGFSKDSDIANKSILIISDKLSFSPIDHKSISRILHRGGKIMIVGSSDDKIDSVLLSKVGIASNNFYYFNIRSLKKSLRQKSNPYTKLYWKGCPNVYKPMTYDVYKIMVNPPLIVDNRKGINILAAVRSDYFITTSLKDTKEQKAKYKNDSLCYTDSNGCLRGIYYDKIAASRKIGKGEIIMVSTPLLFTNYGVLNKKMSPLVLRMMSQISDRPVVRTTLYMKNNNQIEEDSSFFVILLLSGPLRWAFYLTMATILLFMLFTARRRQRVIPVIRAPANKALEFVQLIGTLYSLKKDNTDLVRKKFIYFSEEIRRKFMIDVLDSNDNDHVFTVLSQKTGMEYEYIAETIKSLRILYYYEISITNVEMQTSIDQMNEILNKI